MPSRMDMEAATPTCPRIRVKRAGLTVVPGERCAMPMRYVDARGNVWACPRCLQRVKGLLIVEQQSELPAAA